MTAPHELETLVAEIATEDWGMRLRECVVCGGEGRHLVSHQPTQGEASPCNERDLGPCEPCDGTGEQIVEVHPVTMEDLD